ncbi:hypothetical protein ElyMa_006300700 [Elysia marginata]|uniref:SWIM-type domain-containing protein n=1 Tax=Elysia marginata TaxID=1093978 RepID=A0AAV4HG37_9GAST|nr:hypothetical protein ElyMa_006300700 [Elysia marginata]
MSIIISELKIMFSEKSEFRISGNVIYINKGDKEVEISVDLENDCCLCSFFMDNQLPCWHLMTFKIIEDQPIVNQDSVPKHWLKKTQDECFSQANFSTQASSSVIVSTSQRMRQKTKLTELQKRSKAMILAEELVNVTADCGQNKFDERCTVIERLIREWRAGRDLPASSSSTDQHCDENQNTNDHPRPDALQELNCIEEKTIEPVIFDGVEGESDGHEEVQ